MFKYIVYVIKLLPVLIFDYFAWILPYSRHPKKYPLEKRFAKVQKLVKKVLKALKIDLDIENIELLNDSYIKVFTPNHQSMADPLIFLALSNKPISFVAKIETKKMPIIGRVMRILEGKFLDRKDLRQQLNLLKEVEKSLINQEQSWFIFPEGTRNKDIEHVTINELHPGTYKIVLKSNVPLVPVVIEGTYRVLSTKTHQKRYVVHVSFLDFDYQSLKIDNSVTLRDLVFKEMEQKIIELKQKDTKK